MNDIINARLASYKPSSEIEQENATKEVIQEIALYALWRAKFFDVAVFQGGTSLRILHKLPRFSEDLDFMLLQPDPRFDWGPYLKALTATFEEYGLKPETVAKENMDARTLGTITNSWSNTSRVRDWTKTSLAYKTVVSEGFDIGGERFSWTVGGGYTAATFSNLGTPRLRFDKGMEIEVTWFEDAAENGGRRIVRLATKDWPTL